MSQQPHFSLDHTKAWAKQTCLMDDKYMTSYFNDEKRCTEEVLRIILGEEKDLRVQEVKTQQSYGLPNRREVKLDIIATDAEGKLYNIEIQQEDKGANPKRARYHNSMIDGHAVPKGTPWKNLPSLYIIFITRKDTFGGGLTRYTIERQIRELDRTFEDEVHIIYVNTEVREDSELGRLMEDFLQQDPAKMHNPVLAERAHYLKETERGVMLMNSTWNDIYTEGLQKGHQEGREEGILAILRLLKKNGEDLEGAVREIFQSFPNLSQEDARAVTCKHWFAL